MWLCDRGRRLGACRGESEERSNWKSEVEGALVVTGVTGTTGGWAGDLPGSVPPGTT